MLPWIAWAFLSGVLALLVVRILNKKTEAEGTPPTVQSKRWWGIGPLNSAATLVDFTKDPLGTVLQATREYGTAFTLNLVFAKLTFISGPDARRFFFDAKDNVLNFNKALEVITKNVFGPEWDQNDTVWVPKINKYIHMGFRKFDRLRLMDDFIKAEVRKHVLEWSKADKIDLYPSVSRLVTFINIHCMLGEDVYQKHADEIAKIYYDMEQSAMDPLAIMLPNAPLPVLRRLKHSRKRFVDIVTRCFKARDPNKEYDDYLSLVNQKESENHPLVLFVMHILGLMFAAHTNTAGTPTWVIAHMAHNQSIQEKAREDLQAAEKGDDGKSAAGLSYIDAMLTEANRCYGSLSHLRVANEDIQVTLEGKTFNLPEGTNVLTSAMVPHLDPAVYPEPEVFNPDRWMEPGMKQERSASRELIAWGFGTHQCIGDRYAKTVMNAFMTHLLSEYQVVLASPTTEVPPADWSKQSGVPQPVSSIWVKVKPIGQDK